MWLALREVDAMRAKQLIAVVVAAMLLIGGAAAVGAASPADQANDTAMDAYEQSDADDGDSAADESADNADERADNADERADNAEEHAANANERANSSDSIGPSDGLPEQVPDHVSNIHETIESFLDGTLGSLGEALSDLLSGDGEADNAGNEAV